MHLAALPGIVLVILIILKLTGWLAWSWWWVISPAWLPLALALMFIFTCMAIGFIVDLFEE